MSNIVELATAAVTSSLAEARHETVRVPAKGREEVFLAVEADHGGLAGGSVSGVAVGGD